MLVFLIYGKRSIQYYETLLNKFYEIGEMLVPLRGEADFAYVFKNL